MLDDSCGVGVKASGEWSARINEIVDSVRHDLAGSHSLSELAERADSSQYHFHRRFREVTGETPTQFVRRCRLERAVHLMMAAPDRPLAVIAHEAGFSEQSDFSRSFRQQYGTAPSSWGSRRRRAVDTIAGGNHVRIVSRPAMRLAVLRVRGIFGIDDLSFGYETLLGWANENVPDLRRSALVGMSFDNYRTTPPDRIHYSFGFSVPDSVEPSGQVHIRNVPAFSAAAVSVVGGLADIAAAWDLIFDDWFPPRPWTPSSLPGMKLFRRRPEELGWQDFDLDCAIPFRIDAQD